MRLTITVVAAMAIGRLLAAAAPANATAYTLTTLQVPGTPTTPSPFPMNLGDPRGINNLGQVVGSYSNTNVYDDLHGYLYQNGAYTPINAYGASYVTADGINDLGQIVGTYAGPYPNYSADPHAYLDTNGVFQTLDKPGAYETQPAAINNAGEIVGFYGVPGTGNGRGYIYSNGVFTDIDPFGQTLYTSATGINNLGEIVGNVLINQGAGGGFSYIDDNGIFTKIQVPLPNLYTSVSGINDAGQVVGTYSTNASVNGFIYQNGTYSYFTLPELASPVGINNAGQIIADYNNGGILATPVAVAEPANLALFGFGVAGLALARSRVNRQAKSHRPA